MNLSFKKESVRFTIKAYFCECKAKNTLIILNKTFVYFTNFTLQLKHANAIATARTIAVAFNSMYKSTFHFFNNTGVPHTSAKVEDKHMTWLY